MLSIFVDTSKWWWSLQCLKLKPIYLESWVKTKLLEIVGKHGEVRQNGEPTQLEKLKKDRLEKMRENYKKIWKFKKKKTSA